MVLPLCKAEMLRLKLAVGNGREVITGAIQPDTKSIVFRRDGFSFLFTNMAPGPATPDAGTKQSSATSLGVLLSPTAFQLQPAPHLILPVHA